MKKNSYEYPNSSFLGMSKDASLIIQRLIKNQTILKLLAYGVRDWRTKPDVTPEMIEEMFRTKQISAVPQVRIDRVDKTYLRLIYGSVVPNNTNPFYKDNTFSIDIICHYDTWDLGNFELRPYRLAGEIDAILNNSRLTGIGLLQFVSASPYVYNQEFAGVSLNYYATRGNEDRKRPLNEDGKE